jgi:hypothetical protein
MADQSTTPPPAETAEATPKKSSHKWAIMFGIAALIGLGLWTASAIKKNNEEPKPATVSGIVDFSGLKPTGNEIATVAVWEKETGTADFKNTGIQVELADNAVWNWPNAVEGKTYDFKAVVTRNTETIKESPIVTTSAPATDTVLVLDITWDDLPDEVAQEFPVSVSGRVNINGFIPQGATVIGYGRRAGSLDDFKPGRTRDAIRTIDWVYDDAMNGRNYEIKAVMFDAAGYNIGESDTITKTAPFSDGNMTINSTASAPAVQASISGTVKINGGIQSGSEVDIQIKKSTDSTYTTVASLPAETNTPWEWAGAVSGVTYNVKAVLDMPEGVDPTSPAQTVTAPAADLVVKIDSGTSLGSPGDTPSLKGCEKENDEWVATLKYKSIEGAKKFWVEVGSAEGQSNILDEKEDAPPEGDSLEVEANVKENNMKFYTRYAYSPEDTGADSSFSDWSDTLEFECTD